MSKKKDEKIDATIGYKEISPDELKEGDELYELSFKKYTLKDLKKIELDKEKKEYRFAFPNSPMSYNEKDAEMMLEIANFTGILTDGLRAETTLRLINEIKALKKYQNEILESTKEMRKEMKKTLEHLGIE